MITPILGITVTILRIHKELNTYGKRALVIILKIYLRIIFISMIPI